MDLINSAQKVKSERARFRFKAYDKFVQEVTSKSVMSKWGFEPDRFFKQKHEQAKQRRAAIDTGITRLELTYYAIAERSQGVQQLGIGKLRDGSQLILNTVEAEFLRLRDPLIGGRQLSLMLLEDIQEPNSDHSACNLSQTSESAEYKN